MIDGREPTGSRKEDRDFLESVERHGFRRTRSIAGAGDRVWPVGSIFLSVVPTNPATLLGFGTWIAFAAGRVLAGIDAGDADFDSVEETGGAKTHSHSIDPPITDTSQGG
jgi:hypothetical protein